MLRLDLSHAPRWVELLPGVRLKLRPLTTALMVAARTDPAVAALPAESAADGLALAMARAVARLAIIEWEGVGDAQGHPLPATPEHIDALLEVWPAFDAFQTRYLAAGLLLAEEGNASAPSPSGPSAGARRSAAPARRRAATVRRERTGP